MRTISLVLLPGMDGTGEMFAPLLAAAGARYALQCIRYPDDATLGYGELEQLVRAQLPLDRPYVVVGESFSGPIAASLSAVPPPGMVAVVLCCTFVRNPRPRFAVLGGLLRFAPLKSAPMGAVAALLMGRHSSPALRQALAAALAQVSHATLQTRLRAVLHVDVRARLAAAKVPVLYLQARQDDLLPASAADEVRASLPVVSMVTIDGPHLLLQTRPGLALAVIQPFIGRCFVGTVEAA